jgi:hypothetical protein
MPAAHHFWCLSNAYRYRNAPQYIGAPPINLRIFLLRCCWSIISRGYVLGVDTQPAYQGPLNHRILLLGCRYGLYDCAGGTPLYLSPLPPACCLSNSGLQATASQGCRQCLPVMPPLPPRDAASASQGCLLGVTRCWCTSLRGGGRVLKLTSGANDLPALLPPDICQLHLTVLKSDTFKSEKSSK